jgi:hypothetical protein
VGEGEEEKEKEEEEKYCYPSLDSCSASRNQLFSANIKKEIPETTNSIFYGILLQLFYFIISLCQSLILCNS